MQWYHITIIEGNITVNKGFRRKRNVTKSKLNCTGKFLVTRTRVVIGSRPNGWFITVGKLWRKLLL